MTSALEQHVERLAALRHQLRDLEAQERKLTASISAQMQEQGRTEVRGSSVEARLISVERMSVSPQKLRRILGEKDFLTCVTVQLAQARKHLGERALRRIAAIQRSFQLRLNPRDPASLKMPSRADAHATPHIDVA